MACDEANCRNSDTTPCSTRSLIYTHTEALPSWMKELTQLEYL